MHSASVFTWALATVLCHGVTSGVAQPVLATSSGGAFSTPLGSNPGLNGVTTQPTMSSSVQTAADGLPALGGVTVGGVGGFPTGSDFGIPDLAVVGGSELTRPVPWYVLHC